MANKKTVFSNMAWRFFERIGAQGVKLLVEIVLARILLPDDYGLIALVTVVISILNIFVDSGLGNALIQKKDTDNLDFSTVFWFNLVWCILIYIALFLASPFIADFYKRPELLPVIRVLGLQIVISGVKNVQQAFVSRTFQFKKFFFATIGGTIGAAVVGIWMAYNGLGVWALVTQQLFNVLMDTIILWITIKWRPTFEFSFKRLKSLLSFGWKLLVSALIDSVYTAVRQLIIGKKYSADSLAFYNRGNQFPYIFVANANNAIDSVLLPTMSKEQDDKARLKSMTRRAIKTSVYVMAPMMMGLAFIGDPFIRLLLTEKWLPCVPYMRIFCISFMFYPIHTANLNAIKAMGRSDLFLKLEVAKKIVGIIALLLTMNISVMAMAYSMLFTSILSQIINSWPNRNLLEYKYFDQLKDIMPSILLAIFMGICITPVQLLNFSDLLTVFVQIVLGGVIYIGCSKLFKMESYFYIKEILLCYIRKK